MPSSTLSLLSDMGSLQFWRHLHALIGSLQSFLLVQNPIGVHDSHTHQLFSRIWSMWWWHMEYQWLILLSSHPTGWILRGFKRIMQSRHLICPTSLESPAFQDTLSRPYSLPWEHNKKAWLSCNTIWLRAGILLPVQTNYWHKITTLFKYENTYVLSFLISVKQVGHRQYELL